MWTPGRIAWLSCMCVGTVYSYLWDILMDWSLLERVPQARPSSVFTCAGLGFRYP